MSQVANTVVVKGQPWIDALRSILDDWFMRPTPLFLALVTLGCAPGCSSVTEEGQGGATGDPGSTCDLPQESGSCEGAFPRWWFNAANGSCEQFSYGGCEGNDNNFETLTECGTACAPGTEPCAVADCGSIGTCVYLGIDPSCAVMCGEGCAAPCVCGRSCPNCDDCTEVCPPP
jgi:hypothetical protein